MKYKNSDQENITTQSKPYINFIFNYLKNLKGRFYYLYM